MNLYSEFKLWIEKTLGLEDIPLEKPRISEHGHFSTPVALGLAKKESKNPKEVAEDLAAKIRLAKFRDYKKLPFEVEIAGPGFINFRFGPRLLLDEVMDYLTKGALVFEPKNELVMIEYLSPNTNKSLHIGHLRNLSLGFSVGKILEKVGYKINFTEVVNDRGVAICKAMLMYKLFGNNETPKTAGLKGDDFMGKYYVMFSQKVEEDPSFEEKAQSMLVDWEAGDPETIALWKKMLDWYYEGYNETVSYEHIHFDSHYYESDHYMEGADIVHKFEKEGSIGIVVGVIRELVGILRP